MFCVIVVVLCVDCYITLGSVAILVS